ncbi:unnamed protein product [Linum tenue]|uniref:Nucleoplasmin-like domain-containing protein n=1 Tax=Linum tenue TaxID=586396 RepID=A0AAV0QJU3_9ROSI|nr:unnamed protein product [Linum tenue]
MSSSMEFWGVEVKAGQPLKVTPEDDVILHLSHAALGEAKKTKENEFVPLFIKVGDKKLVLGTLSPETIPQLAFDLVLEQEFELSHNWKNGSIYFTGYKSILPDVASNSPETGKVQKAKPAAPAKAAAAKPEAAKPKSKAAAVPVKPENESDESDDDEDDSDDDSDESGEDAGADSDEDDDSDDSEDEKTPTPKKPEQGKKRSNDSAVKTPVPAKKAKQATPAKTGELPIKITPMLSLVCSVVGDICSLKD